MSSGSSLAVGMRGEVQHTSEGVVSTTSRYYCANKTHSVSHQKIMFILDISDLPDNPNRLPFNKRKVTRPAEGMVSSSRGIPVVFSMYASAFKITGDSKYAFTMMHEYATTSILLNSLVLVSVMLCASV